MANSRLEKIGTIFTRTRALLKTGAMRPEDKPLWYDIYKAFPPKLEPRFDRPAPNVEIRPIFYEEDRIRARFHKEVRQNTSILLNSTARATESQMFIEIYQKLAAQGPLSDDKIFDTALELLQEKLQKEKDERVTVREEVKLVDNWKASKITPEKGENVDLKDIFKD